MKFLLLFLLVVFMEAAAFAKLKPGNKYEWTKYMFFDLYAELPDDENMAKSIFNQLDNLSENLPPGFQKHQGIANTAAPHEAAHLLFMSLYNKRVSPEVKKSHKNYGSYTYDWADEATAVFCENKASKDNRRGQLRKAIPLNEFFIMPHPAVGAGGKEDITKLNNPDVISFYAQALALTEYMRQKGGKPFYRYFVLEQAKGIEIDEILKKWNVLVKKVHKTKEYRENLRSKAESLFPEPLKMEEVLLLPGEKIQEVPSSLSDFEKDFKRWIKSRFKRNDEKLLKIPSDKN